MTDWVAKDCAQHTGLQDYTWLAYVHRGQAPQAYKRVSNTQVWEIAKSCERMA